MSKKQKRQLKKILLSAVFFVGAFFAGEYDIYLAAIAFIICGRDSMVRAVKNLVRLNPLDEHLLMTVASIGAFLIGEPVEGAAVMVFYQVGELFQSIAVSKSRREIAALADIAPEFACVLRHGEFVTVSPEEVALGDVILIKPGERVPVDCKVTEGKTDIDTKAITGEGVPVSAAEGDEIKSGCVNLSGAVKACATATYKNSTVSKILELTENVSSRKSKYESFIHRFALVYTPVVVGLAVALAVIPSLILGNPIEWIKRAITFLVISCPCALVISVPLAFFAGLGRASAGGILIKGSNFLEALAKVDTAVFDKTGTLTSGGFFVTEITPCNISAEELMRVCASAEIYSNHPVSEAIKNEYKGELTKITEAKESAGMGVVAQSDEGEILAGNSRLMSEYGIECGEILSSGTHIYVAQNGKFLGTVTVNDKVKENAKSALTALKSQGIKSTVILTGDKRKSAEVVALSVGADQVKAELLPQDKVSAMEEIMKQSRGMVMFCGDGINDAPVMAMADVSVSMGQIGQDAAIEASDVVLTDDNLEKLPSAIHLAKKTVSIARANIVFSIGVKVAVLILGALGITNIWAAVFADVGVCVVAVLNSVRILSEKMTKF